MSDTLNVQALEQIWQSDEHLLKIQNNWKMFETYTLETGKRSKKITEMLNVFSDRVCMSPASSKIEYHNAFPGGFIDHSLRVLKNTVALAACFKLKVQKESLIISSLFHDWGKAGTVDNDYYLPQTSSWHRERGIMYTKNDKIKLSNAQLGLFTMSNFGIQLSEEEYMAILLNDGQYVEANKEYAMKECSLALLVHMSDRWSSQCEKKRTSLLDSDQPIF